MCDLCTEKDRTIAALENTVRALEELVNTQRAIPTLVGGGLQASQVAPLPGRSPLEELGPEEPDQEDIMAQLNAGVDQDTADRLLAHLQVVK